jgi:hypothetical protein
MLNVQITSINYSDFVLPVLLDDLRFYVGIQSN